MSFLTTPILPPPPSLNNLHLFHGEILNPIQIPMTLPVIQKNKESVPTPMPIRESHQRKRFNQNLDLYLSDSDSEEGFSPSAKLSRKISHKSKSKTEELVDDETDEKETDAERVRFLDQEIFRLQNLCRENFCLIDTLRKENTKLIEIHSELKETTTDLAYSLAECPWWEKDEYKNMAFRIMTSYTQNIQYILELPTFIDPIEQLETTGLSTESAVRILQRKGNRRKVRFPETGKNPKPKIFFKCQKCRKYFSSENRFKSHSLMIHSTQKKLVCKVCEKNFVTFSQFKEHRQVHKLKLHEKSELSILITSNSSNTNDSRGKDKPSQRSTQEQEIQTEIPSIKADQDEDMFTFSNNNNNPLPTVNASNQSNDSSLAENGKETGSIQ